MQLDTDKIQRIIDRGNEALIKPCKGGCVVFELKKVEVQRIVK
jgi:hypothetical protein